MALDLATCLGCGGAATPPLRAACGSCIDVSLDGRRLTDDQLDRVAALLNRPHVPAVAS